MTPALFARRPTALSAWTALSACLATALPLLAQPAQAASTNDWPKQKPITLVIPFPPGGPTDMVGRVLAQQVSEQIGQTIVVDNRPGANANIGNAAVAKAAADGYTILYNTSSISLSPSLYKKLSYDVNKDLTPVVLTATVPMALVVNPKMPVNNMAEFVAYAKANPGKLSYGSAGAGNTTHLTAFRMGQSWGIDTRHVPYKGSAPADADLVAGHIDFMTDTINSVAPFIADGKLRLLAVTTGQRLANFPNAPTLAESGLKGFDVGAWQGVMVPAKTPQAIVDRLHAEFNKALKAPAVQDKLKLQSAVPLGGTSKAYGDYIQAEIKRWASVVKDTGVSLD